MNNTGATQQSQNEYLSGLFNDREGTERAYTSLRDRGYSEDEIDVLMSDETRDRHYKNGPDTELGSKALEGTGAGAAIGGTIGAIVAGIAAIGTNLFLPGLGIVVWGPLAAALAGAGAGGATGGLVGALIGAGIPEDRAKAYETGIQNGGTVVGVRPRNPEDAEYFRSEWRNYRGEQVY